MVSRAKNKQLFIHDVLIIAGSVAVAVVLAKTHAIQSLLEAVHTTGPIGSFIAGIFFTSVFTTPPAIIALGEIAQVHPILSTALFGALGAVIGDLIIFHFIRDRFSEHLLALSSRRGIFMRIRELFRRRMFRVVSLFVGGFIIASPLPDELGIGLLGMSHTKTRFFIPLSFVFNFIGIFLIGLAAQSFLP